MISIPYCVNNVGGYSNPVGEQFIAPRVFKVSYFSEIEKIPTMGPYPKRRYMFLSAHHFGVSMLVFSGIYKMMLLLKRFLVENLQLTGRAKKPFKGLKAFASRNCHGYVGCVDQ